MKRRLAKLFAPISEIPFILRFHCFKLRNYVGNVLKVRAVIESQMFKIFELSALSTESFNGICCTNSNS